MIKVDAYLELNPPEFLAGFLDADFEIEAKIEEDLNVECSLEKPISIEATLTEKYELEE